ncbi:MAG: GntR family transcriptional regulator [Phyllobacteriaceae bacterium]|jgi:DNA-binding GntR family transcriptional regulator|nr:GntR family transcriptional regulator [Phyllobacteriaceae bacterium]
MEIDSAVAGRPPAKSDQIYEFLRRAIVRLDLQPGCAIQEKDICLRFAVSRTPVREALQRLSEEDLVTIHAHSGTWVSHISFPVAEEGFVLRRALEIESVRKAAELITSEGAAGLHGHVAQMRVILAENRLSDYLEEDDAFHAAIARISGYPRIWKFITLAKVHLDRMRQLSAPVPGHLAEVTEQHAAIAQALQRGNAMQAELAMRIHLDSSFAVMAAMFDGSAALFSDNTDHATGGIHASRSRRPA